MKLILAEKPSVAKSLAETLLTNPKKSDGYFTDNSTYYITYAFGHLLNLYDYKDYDPTFTKWELDRFPFIPEKFKYKIIESRDNSIKKQFLTIKKLVNAPEVTEIINAADGDREGELLSSMILSATGTKKPVKRLWISSHTPRDILNGMKNLIDDNKMIPLKNAGFARQKTDWLIGINYTCLATLQYGNGKGSLLTIGRCVLPTLKLIYDRDMQIKNFKPEDYYELWGSFEYNSKLYKGIYFDAEKHIKFKTSDSLKNIKSTIDNKTGLVVKKIIEESIQSIPSLFNLSLLQGHITSKYNNWTASKVLSVCQKLYESGYITYPRVESTVLNETQVDEAKNILYILSKDLSYNNLIKFKVTKKVFNSAKVDSHPAIIPTYIIPTNLSSDERIIYEEIKKRFIAQFMPDAVFEKTEIITDVQGFKFLSKGKVLISSGWLVLYEKELNTSSEDESDNEQLLPDVRENTQVNSLESIVLNKQTRPPKHYTENTLLSAMKSCGNKILEENIDLVLKGYSIGTAATRAETIQKLESNSYITRKNKTLSITDVGIRLIEIFPVKDLMDIDYTGKLEMKLKSIENGQYDANILLNEVIESIKTGSNIIKNTSGTVKEKTTASTEALGKCPQCKEGNIIEGKKGYGCSRWKQGCNFVIWKEKCGKKISKTTVKSILSHGKSKEIQGFISKNKKSFSAVLELKYEGDKCTVGFKDW